MVLASVSFFIYRQGFDKNLPNRITLINPCSSNSHESFFCANILTVVISVYVNNKSNHINLLFCFALNITSSLNMSTTDNLKDKFQFIGGIINELAVTNPGGYGVSP